MESNFLMLTETCADLSKTKEETPRKVQNQWED
jgi:hypothetical protein